jgi:Neuraminidase (sialidase)
MIRSKDNGATWSEPETISNTPLDDRDAGILETKDGTLVVSWFTSLAFANDRFYKGNPSWKRHADKLGPETRERWLGNWIRRSIDNGQTWEEPVKQNGTAPHGPIELADGRLLYVGTGKIDGKKVNSVEESPDGGKTWKMLSTIDIPDDEDIKYYHEPHVAELPDGKLVAQIRYQPSEKADSYLRQSESSDGGKTWSVAHTTPIWGYPPHLIVLDNGWLMTVYGVRRKPYSERACISRDGGKTWDIKHEIILEHAMNGDLGYPASVQLDDGAILTIYYQIDKKGEKTCLMGTKWKLK